MSNKSCSNCKSFTIAPYNEPCDSCFMGDNYEPEIINNEPIPTHDHVTEGVMSAKEYAKEYYPVTWNSLNLGQQGCFERAMKNYATYVQSLKKEGKQ